MILFKPEHVTPILSGRKTQTRRTGRLRWKVGAIRQAKTGYSRESEFAKIRVTAIRQEPLGAISHEDAIREGYESIEKYKEVFRRIYGYWNDELEVWVIDFERVEE